MTPATTEVLTDFLRSNRIEVLNVARPRESKEPGVYEWALSMLRAIWSAGKESR
jgi:hypothetical protein